MDTAQVFVPVGAPIVDARGFPTDAMVRFMLALYNRTGQELGVDTGGLELLNALEVIRPVSDDPAEFLFALMMALMQVRATPSASTSGLITAPLTASETITAPALGNVFNNSGTPNVRNADGSVFGKDATCYIKTSVGVGGTATCCFDGIITGLSGLTGGYAYLGATPGLVTSTPLTTSGQTSQRVGIAVSATALVFAPQASIQL